MSDSPILTLTVLHEPSGEYVCAEGTYNKCVYGCGTMMYNTWGTAEDVDITELVMYWGDREPVNVGTMQDVLSYYNETCEEGKPVGQQIPKEFDE